MGQTQRTQNANFAVSKFLGVTATNRLNKNLQDASECCTCEQDTRPKNIFKTCHSLGANMKCGRKLLDNFPFLAKGTSTCYQNGDGELTLIIQDSTGRLPWEPGGSTNYHEALAGDPALTPGMHRLLNTKQLCFKSKSIPLTFANTMTTSEKRDGHTSPWKGLSSRLLLIFFREVRRTCSALP